jgi:hypothetical protein
MIAITVSTNYHDLLPIVYHHNKDYFKHWVFVTDRGDAETINFLSTKPNVTILFWDFQNHRNIFDKGGAIRYAQTFTYEKYPDDWYLLIDSDICLPREFSHFTAVFLPTYDVNLIYGLDERLDFESLEDFQNYTNYKKYEHGERVDGYFQLYKDKFFYNTSSDASNCDNEFAKRFPGRNLILGIPCVHLGNKSHWNGKRELGSDFKL